MGWEFEWDRSSPSYTLLGISYNDDPRGSVIIRSQEEEDTWKKSIEMIYLNQKTSE